MRLPSTLPAPAGLAAVALVLCAACGEPLAEEPPPPPASAGTAGTAGTSGASGPAGSLAATAAAPATASARHPRLIDEARARGLDHHNRSGGPEKAIVLEANGAGVALLDLGGDGDLDVVFAQGLASFEALGSGPGADLEVYVNDGEGRFRRAAGPGLSGWWTGLATGDVDGDGDCDLVAGGYGGLVVLTQDEDGVLRVAADLLDGPLAAGEPGARLVPGAEHPPGAAPWWVTSLALFDADRDGNLDLYVGRYLELDPRDPPRGSLGEGALAVPCRWRGHEVFCGPHGLVPQSDRLLRGRGDGTFDDASAAWLPDHVPGYTLGVATFDFDDDRDTDVYVANDSVANLLLVNDGSGRLVDVGYSAGVAVSMDGAPLAGMGVAVGDVNRDGHLDLAVTNFSGEPTQLWLGGPRGFQDRTHRLGLLRETRALLSWGTHMVDFDGDGFLELFTANGHVYPQADLPDTGTSYGQADTLWELGAGEEARAVAADDPASVLAPVTGTRGSAVGDVDGDGAPDLVLDRIDGPAALGINRSTPAARRLVVRCAGAGPAKQGAGPRTPRDGNGARVTLLVQGEAGEVVSLVREVRTAVGYQSASDAALYFGLADRDAYLDLQVAWPSGATESLGPGPAGERLTLVEGRGIVAREALR